MLGDRGGGDVAALAALVGRVADALGLGERLRPERGVEGRRAADGGERVRHGEGQRVARADDVNLLHFRFPLLTLSEAPDANLAPDAAQGAEKDRRVVRRAGRYGIVVNLASPMQPGKLTTASQTLCANVLQSRNLKFGFHFLPTQPAGDTGNTIPFPRRNSVRRETCSLHCRR